MALVVVVVNAVVCEVSFVALRWCLRSGQVSEARLESTFLADDAACLTLVRAVIQPRCSEIVSLGCGRLSCVVVWFPQWNMGFGRVLFPQSHRVAHHYHSTLSRTGGKFVYRVSRRIVSRTRLSDTVV